MNRPITCPRAVAQVKGFGDLGRIEDAKDGLDLVLEHLRRFNWFEAGGHHRPATA